MIEISAAARGRRNVVVTLDFRSKINNAFLLLLLESTTKTGPLNLLALTILIGCCALLRLRYSYKT